MLHRKDGVIVNMRVHVGMQNESEAVKRSDVMARTEGWETKSSVLLYTRRGRKHNRAFDFHKQRQQIIQGLRRRRIRQKGFWIQFFSEKGKQKKNHPAALINACGKQSSHFALMRFESSCLLLQLKRISLNPVSHGSVSVTNALQRSARHRPSTSSLPAFL